MKENLHFKQLRMNYINNQKQKQEQKKKKTHKISHSLYWGLLQLPDWWHCHRARI